MWLCVHTSGVRCHILGSVVPRPVTSPHPPSSWVVGGQHAEGSSFRTSCERLAKLTSIYMQIPVVLLLGSNWSMRDIDQHEDVSVHSWRELTCTCLFVYAGTLNGNESDMRNQSPPEARWGLHKDSRPGLKRASHCSAALNVNEGVSIAHVLSSVLFFALFCFI